MENEIRPPDDIVAHRLLEDVPLETEEDFEIHQALEISRREFLLLQRKLEEEEKEKQRLRQALALPLSRIRLWLQNTNNTQEKEFLDFIVKRVNHRLYNDLDIMPTLNEQQKEKFLTFLKKDLASKQFQEIIDITIDCTNSSPFKQTLW